MRSSGKAAATASLISRLEARSVPERLFQREPHVRAGQAGALEPPDRGAEQGRSGRKEDGEAALVRPHRFGEPAELVAIRCVERDIAQAREEALDTLRRPPLGIDEALQRRSRRSPEAVVVEIASRGADDAERKGEQAVAVQTEQRAEEHALSKIAGRSEQQQGISGHGRRLSFPFLGQRASARRN